ncbi:DNA-processing protein DprA, partial [Acinetobacter baumannii]
SGAAYGIDGAAHRAALSMNGRTVAFLAGGVDRAYPRGHEALLTRIAQTGAVVSETPCGAAPTKWRCVYRTCGAVTTFTVRGSSSCRQVWLWERS